MVTNIQERILNSVYACMLPLVRLLLRAGVTYKQFDVVARRAFIREAMSERDSHGRALNTSRIAVKTGVSRKEVKRIREALTDEGVPGSGATLDHSGPLARVLHAWHSDARFCGQDGAPIDLAFQDGEPNFGLLVRAVAGDVPPGAVRTELKRAGAIVDLDDGRLRAVKRYYVPGNVDQKAVTVLSGMVFPMISGIAHNADPRRNSEGFIQRYAYSESLDQASMLAFRRWSRAEAIRFVESMDDWLAMNESGVAEDVDGGRQSSAGIGVFYYEGPTADDVTASLGSDGAKKSSVRQSE